MVGSSTSSFYWIKFELNTVATCGREVQSGDECERMNFLRTLGALPCNGCDRQVFLQGVGGGVLDEGEIGLHCLVDDAEDVDVRASRSFEGWCFVQS